MAAFGSGDHKLIERGFFRDSATSPGRSRTGARRETPGERVVRVPSRGDLVPGQADLIAFTAEEGANFHCQPLGRLLTEERMFNWLEDFMR